MRRGAPRRRAGRAEAAAHRGRRPCCSVPSCNGPPCSTTPPPVCGCGGCARPEPADSPGRGSTRSRSRTSPTGTPARCPAGRPNAWPLPEPSLSSREVLLLDEPFTGLDATTRADLIADLRAALDQSTAAVLLVTHDRDEGRRARAPHSPAPPGSHPAARRHGRRPRRTRRPRVRPPARLHHPPPARAHRPRRASRRPTRTLQAPAARGGACPLRGRRLGHAAPGRPTGGNHAGRRRHRSGTRSPS